MSRKASKPSPRVVLFAWAMVLLPLPGIAADLGRLLPDIELPSFSARRIEAPASPPAPVVSLPVTEFRGAENPVTSADSADVEAPPKPGELDPTLQDGERATDRPPASRPRGWRGLLPGSLK
jgi:hypothetical protein